MSVVNHTIDQQLKTNNQDISEYSLLMIDKSIKKRYTRY